MAPYVHAVPSPPPAVRLCGLRKEYRGHPAVVAVDSIDLTVADGEFFSMLGPSGSGKTTVLRMIAGFEVPTAGTVELAGEDVTALPAYRRDVNTVFQDYALFPHMSVQENVEYGLRVAKVATAERRRRATEALEQVRLSDLGRRRPAQLSGGQRQRIALARALVNRPRVLLLDEPLGALDLKLREQMQVELKTIQREVGITFVFVTHDQEEALTLSDRVAVFNQGRIEQVGTAREVYDHPATDFVAGFVGTSNLLPDEVSQSVLSRAGRHAIRPEKLHLDVLDGPPPPGHPSTDATLAEVVYAGPVTRYLLDLTAGPRLVAVRQNDSRTDHEPSRGERVRLWWRPENVISVPLTDPSPTKENHA